MAFALSATVLSRTRAALLVVLLPLAAAASDLDQWVPVGAGSRLRIELDEGTIRVTPHAASEVRIEARARGLGAKALHFRLREERGVVVLTAHPEPWLGWLQAGPRIEVEAWVPSDCQVELERSAALPPARVRAP